MAPDETVHFPLCPPGQPSPASTVFGGVAEHAGVPLVYSVQIQAFTSLLLAEQLCTLLLLHAVAISKPKEATQNTRQKVLKFLDVVIFIALPFNN